jgi:hypothetical protein
VIVLACEQRLALQQVHCIPQDIELAAQVSGNVFAFPRQLEVGIRVGKLAGELLVGLEGLFQASALGEDALGSFLVLPEVRAGYLLFEGRKFLASLRRVKESSAVRQRAVSGPQIPFPVLRSQLLLRNRCQLSGAKCQLPAFTGPRRAVSRQQPAATPLADAQRL